MIHRAAELRMRVQHDGNWRILLRRRVVPGFDPAGGSGKNDLRHVFLEPRSITPAAA
jgi:hypothetical protein